MPQSYSNVQNAIHSKNLFTYQINYDDSYPNDNLYVKLDGTYNVTNDGQTVKRGTIDPVDVGLWLDELVSQGYVLDYPPQISGPHRMLRFMDINGAIWFLGISPDLPMPNQINPLVEFLNDLMIIS